jgi:hypothetical protein
MTAFIEITKVEYDTLILWWTIALDLQCKIAGNRNKDNKYRILENIGWWDTEITHIRNVVIWVSTSTAYLWYIHARDYRRDKQKRTTQRNWQQDEEKRNKNTTQYVLDIWFSKTFFCAEYFKKPLKLGTSVHSTVSK